MDILSNLKPAKGSVKKVKRVGRGPGSGHGGTSTRGMNGQKSRSGSKYRAWFEGGQMPLQRRVPKKGFKNPNRVQYQVINLDSLSEFVKKYNLGESEITPEVMYKYKIAGSKLLPIKILGEGKIISKVIISAHAFSKTAKEKIEAAGGKTNIVKF